MLVKLFLITFLKYKILKSNRLHNILVLKKTLYLITSVINIKVFDKLSFFKLPNVMRERVSNFPPHSCTRVENPGGGGREGDVFPKNMGRGGL